MDDGTITMEGKGQRVQAAKGAQPPVHVRALTFVLDVACGRHALSPLIPVALWLADAVLTCLVIWKVPCRSLMLGRGWHVASCSSDFVD